MTSEENEKKQEVPDPGVVLKHELRARKEELQRPEATTKSQYVALVERNWFKAMVLWMNSKHGEAPGPIPNHLLCKDGKLDASKHYGRDFAVMSDSIYDRLSSFFKGGPKIVRPYALSPGTDKPQFIMDPFTLCIIVDNKTLKKVVDPKWKIGPIRSQLCSTLRISKNKSRFIVRDTKEIADDNADIDQVINRENTVLVFDVDPEGRGPEYTRFKTFEKAPIKLLSIPDKSSTFLVCVECLLNIPALTDFVLAEGFEHQINPNNKRGSGGEIAKSFLSLSKSRASIETNSVENPTNNTNNTSNNIINSLNNNLNNMNNENNTNNMNNAFIDANPLKIAVLDKYPDLLDFGRFDADGTLAALLDGLFEDTNRAQSVEDGSPIAEIFLGTLRGSLECPNCHQAEEIKERFLFLSLSIPQDSGIGAENDGITLLDCIAHFSVSEKIPEQNRIKCKSCKKLVRSYRTVAVDICPEILIISFKRMGSLGALSSFVQTPISYPDEIDVASFASSSSGTYRLINVIFHQGFVDDGKYSCCCLNQKTEQWTYISKDKALLVDSSGAHSGDALVLFYQRKKK